MRAARAFRVTESMSNGSTHERSIRMRPRALVLSLVGCAAALGVTWEIGQTASPQVGVLPEAAAPASGGATSPAPRPSTPGPSGSAAARPSGTFSGATAQTDYGPVQVAIVVHSGTIVDVKALQLTNQGDRSVAISAAAVPILRHEALQAQSAKIDTVSGATYTSDGYRRSLQSAIDKAGL